MASPLIDIVVVQQLGTRQPTSRSPTGRLVPQTDCSSVCTHPVQPRLALSRTLPFCLVELPSLSLHGPSGRLVLLLLLLLLRLRLPGFGQFNSRNIIHMHTHSYSEAHARTHAGMKDAVTLPSWLVFIATSCIVLNAMPVSCRDGCLFACYWAGTISSPHSSRPSQSREC